MRQRRGTRPQWDQRVTRRKIGGKKVRYSGSLRGLRGYFCVHAFWGGEHAGYAGGYAWLVIAQLSI
jgi:hypothetical protein